MTDSKQDPKPLEGPDELISLRRAAKIAGLQGTSTLRHAALDGRLRTKKLDLYHFTTRRWLHEYLTHRRTTRGGGRAIVPFPEGYVAPDEEQQG